MKSLYFIFLCFVLSATVSAQKTGRETVLANMALQQDAWNAGDVHGFMGHYWKSDSLKFIGSRGVTYGWQPTLDNYLKSYPDQAAMGRLRFTIIEAAVLSPVSVYVVGKWELQKEMPAGGHFTLLWRKIDGRWVIVSDHTS